MKQTHASVENRPNILKYMITRLKGQKEKATTRKKNEILTEFPAKRKGACAISQNSSKETARGSNINKPGNLPFTKVVRLNFSRKIFYYPNKPRKTKKFWSNITAT